MPIPVATPAHVPPADRSFSFQTQRQLTLLLSGVDGVPQPPAGLRSTFRRIEPSLTCCSNTAIAGATSPSTDVRQRATTPVLSGAPSGQVGRRASRLEQTARRVFRHPLPDAAGCPQSTTRSFADQFSQESPARLAIAKIRKCRMSYEEIVKLAFRREFYGVCAEALPDGAVIQLSN